MKKAVMRKVDGNCNGEISHTGNIQQSLTQLTVVTLVLKSFS